jgi:protease-4
MNESTSPQPNPPTEPNSGPSRPFVIQSVPPPPPPRGRGFLFRLLVVVLLISVVANFAMYSQYQQYFAGAEGPREQYHSGERNADALLALIKVNGTIMPPFTGRILSSIKRAREDARVKGVVLVVDSPGGMVADSHQIYHALKQLREESHKPIVVAMQRMSASGGYYISMGAGTDGKLYVEPTTWTGSIGVIIPRFDLSELARKWGVESAPLKTGPFKDALSPFRELGDDERDVWLPILDDAFQRFLNVIAENRANLDYQAVKDLATGQIYTADQAKANGLVDEIGFEEDAIAHLKEQLGLTEARVVTYEFQPGLWELLSGRVEANQPADYWRQIVEASVPRAMYFCSSFPVQGTLSNR